MSVQYPVLGFELMTSWTLVSSHTLGQELKETDMFLELIVARKARWQVYINSINSKKICYNLRWSQCDQVDKLFVQFLAIYNNETLPNSI